MKRDAACEGRSDLATGDTVVVACGGEVIAVVEGVTDGARTPGEVRFGYPPEAAGPRYSCASRSVST